MVAPERTLRGTTGPGDQVRRRDRRNRPREARGRHEHVRGRGAALRPHSAHAPRHLRDERNPRTRRTHSGRAVQHPRRTRRADSRLSDSVRSRRADSLHRQPGDVQSFRQGHSAVEGPHRVADSDALPARTGARHRDHGAGSRPGEGRRIPGVRAVLHEGDRGADQYLRTKEQVRGPRERRERAIQYRELPHDGRKRAASRRASGRNRWPSRGSATLATCRRLHWGSSNST